MALHDLWSYDNSPQSSTDISAGTSLSYPNPGTYNTYTGLPGVCYKNTGGTCTITSDGYLNVISSSSWNPALVIRQNDVQNWSTSTQWWIGFRTKIVGTQSTSTTKIFTIADSLAQSNNVALLSESDMTSFGFATIGTAYYVEIFIDKTNLVYQAYVNGTLVRSGTLSATVVPSGGTGYYFWGGLNSAAATAGATRSFRDYYFLDVDATDTTRLGPIASAPASIASASGSSWTLNGSPANLQAAVTTALGSPPTTTPSASAPANNQALTLALSTGIATGTPIIAVQNQLSITGDAAFNNIDSTYSQNSQNIDLGRMITPVSATTYNQRSPTLMRKAPDGGVWTPAKINATNLVLSPISSGKTVLLMHFDGANGSTTFSDDVGHAPAGQGTVIISTNQSKFGGSSLFTPSVAANAVIVPDAPELRLTGDFTVELFVYMTSFSNNPMLVAKGTQGFLELSTAGQIIVNTDSGGGNLIITASGGVVLNTWTHIALTKAGTTWRAFINGVQAGTATSSATFGNVSNPLWIGNYQSTTSLFAAGYIDELRISNMARYTAGFTVPSAAFVAD